MPEYRTIECPWCLGHGDYARTVCTVCEGYGSISTEQLSELLSTRQAAEKAGEGK